MIKINKIAIIYYSMSGNVNYVANYISDKIGADLIRLSPKEEYPDSGFKKFFWCGKSSVMKEMPLLKDYGFDESKYDTIIFGTPVWAGSFTPPIRTFINDNKDKLVNKNISVFVCSSGGGGDKAIRKLGKYIGVSDIKNKLILVDPFTKMNNDNLKKINDFCIDILNK